MLIVSSSAHAIGSIHGLVTDYYTGQPIAGANVLVDIHTEKVTYKTKDHGTFLAALPAGKMYKVEVSAEGYNKLTRTIFEVPANAIIYEDFRLVSPRPPLKAKPYSPQTPQQSSTNEFISKAINESQEKTEGTKGTSTINTSATGTQNNNYKTISNLPSSKDTSVTAQTQKKPPVPTSSKAKKKRVRPVITAPRPNSVLPGSSVRFNWRASNKSVEGWHLMVGSRPGKGDLFKSKPLPANQFVANVKGLPTDGRRLFVRHGFKVKGRWQYTDAKYKAYQAKK